VGSSKALKHFLCERLHWLACHQKKKA
jgi:hypothetical protein